MQKKNAERNAERRKKEIKIIKNERRKKRKN
jgi:hypothetical protein